MKYLKILGIILIILIICFMAFYLWASQSVISEDDYSYLKNYTNDKPVTLEDTFSITTYNIGYLSGMTNNLPVDRPKELLDNNLKEASVFLRNNKPDIVAFQEIDFHSQRTYYTNQLELLAKNAGYQYGAISVNWDKQYVPFPYWPLKYHFGRMLSGQAILSHSPIRSTTRVVLPKPASNPFYYNDFYLDRLAQLAWIKTITDSILLINVHFEAWDGPTRELQSQIVMDIYAEYETSHPIILLGDFNCPPPFESDAIKENTIIRILNHPSISMVNMETDYLRDPDAYFTFSSDKPYVKIDYIFYNNRYLECLNYRVMYQASDISDHLPVWAKFVKKQ